MGAKEQGRLGRSELAKERSKRGAEERGHKRGQEREARKRG